MIVTRPVVSPVAITAHYSNGSGKYKQSQYWPWICIHYHGGCVRHSPATPYIHPGSSMVGPITSNINVFCFWRDCPVSCHPDVFIVRPPPVTHYPRRIRARLFATIIIHRLAGWCFLRGLLRFGCGNVHFFWFGITLLPLGGFIQIRRFRWLTFGECRFSQCSPCTEQRYSHGGFTKFSS